MYLVFAKLKENNEKTVNFFACLCVSVLAMIVFQQDFWLADRFGLFMAFKKHGPFSHSAFFKADNLLQFNFWKERN